MLICLDGVGHQAVATPVVEVGDLGPGSRILVTSRERAAVGETIYDLDVLDSGEAWELFRWHALGGLKPPSDLVGLAEQAARACAGLPLALRLLGRQVACAEDKSRCLQDSLDLPRFSDSMEDCRSIIRSSYENLSSELKDAFVLIAGLWSRGAQLLDLQRTAEDLGAALYAQEPSGFRRRLARAALEKLATVSLVNLERVEESVHVLVHDLIADVATSVAGDGERFYWLSKTTAKWTKCA